MRTVSYVGEPTPGHCHLTGTPFVIEQLATSSELPGGNDKVQRGVTRTSGSQPTTPSSRSSVLRRRIANWQGDHLIVPLHAGLFSQSARAIISPAQLQQRTCISPTSASGARRVPRRPDRHFDLACGISCLSQLRWRPTRTRNRFPTTTPTSAARALRAAELSVETTSNNAIVGLERTTGWRAAGMARRRRSPTRRNRPCGQFAHRRGRQARVGSTLGSLICLQQSVYGLRAVGSTDGQISQK